MLTTTQKAVLRRVLDGVTLGAQRTYPHPWKWTMESKDNVGLLWYEVGMVAGLVGQGAGHVKDTGKQGHTEFRRFVVDRERALALLAEPKPPAVDPLQTDWIPEDHPAKQPVTKKGR